MNFHPIENAEATAKIVAPILFEMLQPRSVIDFGCNVGCWLEAFDVCGVERLLGLDGDNMIPHLRISRDEFLIHDLKEPFVTQTKFDLALCLEVAEHIDEKYSETLINSIVESADNVFWSAATPDQTGFNHVNEQPHDYWISRFSNRGFLCKYLGGVLPQLPHDYYRKNAWLFVK